MALKILLVEDNELNRDMLTRRLVKRGYELSNAHDGQSAILLVKSLKPDLILLDMSLPILDGWTVARKLKADPETAKIPIIALTAHAMVGDKEKSLEAGCDEYETKPIDLVRLLEKIESLTKT